MRLPPGIPAGRADPGPLRSTTMAPDELVTQQVPQLEVGVGPWAGDWPDDPRLDPELLANGDRRNVVDRYRYWKLEEIVADLDLRRNPFHIAIERTAVQTWWASAVSPGPS